MYVNIIAQDVQKYGGQVSSLVNYLTKEDNLTCDQMQKMEQKYDKTTNYLTKEDTLVERHLNKLGRQGLNKQTLNEYREMLNSPERSIGKEMFFNGADKNIEAESVSMKIGKNNKGLKLNESHYYLINVAPSKAELKYLQKLSIEQLKYSGVKVTAENVEKVLRDNLKEYAKGVMNVYAENFGRDGVSSEKDMVWFGKVEKDRYWKYDAPEVRHNLNVNRQIKELECKGDVKNIQKLQLQLKRDNGCIIYANMPKSGLNHHVHIIVSRKDVTQTKSLSPLSKQRNSPNHKINGKKCKVGFDRNVFYRAMEKKFDDKFAFVRPYHLSVDGLAKKKELAKIQQQMTKATNPKELRQYVTIYNEKLREYKSTQRIYNKAKGITYQPINNRSKYKLIVKSATRTIAKSLTTGIISGLPGGAAVMKIGKSVSQIAQGKILALIPGAGAALGMLSKVGLKISPEIEK